MKKTILSLMIVGIIASPLTIFAADPIQTTVGTATKTQSTVAPQEKLLVKKLGQIKKKNKETKQKIKTNITQSKAQISKVKKERTKIKKARATTIKKNLIKTATTTVR